MTTTAPAARAARVAMLCADLDVGGIQSLVDRLGRGLDATRFTPSFLCFDGRGRLFERLAADGFAVDFVPRRPGIDLGLARRIAAVLERNRIDLVHAHNRTALFYGVVATLFSRRRALVYTEHDRSFPERLRVRGLHAVLARRVDAVAAVCGAVRDAIVATERFPAQRCRVIVNGVADPEPDRDPIRTREAVRAEFAVPRDRPLAVVVGHLTEVKDHATLLGALARIDRSRRPFTVIAGDGPLRAALLELRARLGLDSDVVFAGYRDDVPRLLAAAELLVLSSRSEGLSIALVEAIARGVPIVATRVGGNDEVVGHDENGLLVPAVDEPALAAAIERLAGDSALRDRFSRAARERFARRFRISAMIEAYQDLFVAALTRRAPSGP